jgi:hypothetical protein
MSKVVDPRLEALEEILERLRAVAAQAREVVAPFVRPDFDAAAATLALRPSLEDARAVFAAEVADRVHAGYAVLWDTRPVIRARPGQSEIDVVAALPEILAGDNPISRGFPGGYRGILPWLRPGVPWVRWRYHRPGTGAGMAFDGLVALDGRWAWFPKPWRVVGEVVPQA